MLKFRVNGQNLRRVDSSKVVADSRNYLQAEFKVSSDWSGYEPICATFNRDDKGKCVSVEVVDEVCAVPWEVLEGAGVLEVTLQGGDLITTNVVEIELIDSGELDGLKPTEATPGLYGSLKNRVTELEESVSGLGSEVDTELVKAVNAIVDDTVEATNVKADSVEAASVEADTVTVSSVVFKDGSFYAETVNDDGEKAFIQMDKSTGIRLMSSLDEKSDHTVKIGFYTDTENDDNINGIYYNSGEGIKIGDLSNEGSTQLALTWNSGTPNFIRANETFVIYAGSGRLSFASSDAGLYYDEATFTMDMKQLDVVASKGVNIEAKNNSYFWVNAEKKAVYGNSLNKLEFRASDGVAKFSNVVNAKNYQIGGTDISELYENMQSITYAELVEKVSAAGLVAGRFYRITDYTCTTTQDDTQSAGNVFDVIVRADSESVLNENAWAMQHEGDTYFSNSNLSAWELKYTIDNDKTKYGWADSTNGKGVIYYMKDEFDNECGYDFKNIKFKRYLITASNDTAKYTSDLVNTYSGMKNYNGQYYPNGYTISKTSYTYMYTFNYGGKDYSLNTYVKSNSGYGGGYRMYCRGNKITITKWNDNYSYYSLSSITFNNSSTQSQCYGNSFGNNCYSNSFGNNCGSNSFGNYCYSNSFGNYCYSNSFGNNCGSNSFGNSCYSNSFNENCSGYQNLECKGRSFKFGCDYDSDYGFLYDNDTDSDNSVIYASGTFYNGYETDVAVNISLDFTITDGNGKESTQSVTDTVTVAANDSTDFKYTVAYDPDNFETYVVQGTADFTIFNKSYSWDGYYEW